MLLGLPYNPDIAASSYSFFKLKSDFRGKDLMRVMMTWKERYGKFEEKPCIQVQGDFT